MSQVILASGVYLGGPSDSDPTHVLIVTGTSPYLRLTAVALSDRSVTTPSDDSTFAKIVQVPDGAVWDTTGVNANSVGDRLVEAYGVSWVMDLVNNILSALYGPGALDTENPTYTYDVSWGIRGSEGVDLVNNRFIATIVPHVDP